MPLILGTNSIKDTGYEVANSCRFDSGSSDQLGKNTGTATDAQKFTLSIWLKRSELAANVGACRFYQGYKDGDNRLYFQFDTNDKLFIFARTGGTSEINWTSTRVFRDVSAWYNFVFQADSTDSTQADRMKAYVNGELIDSYSKLNNPSQNINWGNQLAQTGGNLHISGENTGAEIFDGYIAETVFIDGQALDPTSFGEFDSATGIWKPIDVSGLTFGNNGFYLPFENSGALGQDDSGNGNNFTVNNLTSIDQTTDTPTNNFATINSLNTHTSINLSEGNLKATGASSSSWVGGAGTIGITKGFPCYWEAKATTSTRLYFGLSRLEDQDPITNNPSVMEGTVYLDYMWRATSSNTIFYRGSNLGATISAVSTGDIMACSVDSSGIVKFYNNGSVIYTFGQALIDGFFYFPIFALNNFSSTETIEANFGNPAFSISSGNTDADGYGNFEHSPPANHYALNTKNLAEYG